jgi:hypothetical protein
MDSYRKWTEVCRDTLGARSGYVDEFNGLKTALLERFRSAEMQIILHRARESGMSVTDTIEAMITELLDDDAPNIAPPVYNR